MRVENEIDMERGSSISGGQSGDGSGSRAEHAQRLIGNSAQVSPPSVLTLTVPLCSVIVAMAWHDSTRRPVVGAGRRARFDNRTVTGPLG